MIHFIARLQTPRFLRALLAVIGTAGLGLTSVSAQRVDNPYAFTTLAGTKSVAGFANGTGTAAQFSSPSGVAVDSSGNIYVADSQNFVIRKVTSAGAVTTFAGQAGASGNLDGTGTGAKFGVLGGIAIDSGGNLYVTDFTNGTVRKITSGGSTSTLTSGLNGPLGIAVDSANNAYVADSGNFVIRKVSPAGVVTTFAGTVGKSGSITGAAASAQFGYPTGVAVDGATNVYVVDSQYSAIMKVSGGVVSLLGGVPANPGYADGPVASSLFTHPYAIASDAVGDLFITDGSPPSLVREISAAGAVSTLGGNPGLPGDSDGTGVNARFNGSEGIAVTAGGVLFVADTNNETVRQGTVVGVTTPPTIQFQPSGETISLGGSAIFQVTASGANLTYQWYLNGAVIAGATTSVLTVSPVVAASAGSYTFTISNVGGSITSAAAVLTVPGTGGGTGGTVGAHLVNLSARANAAAGSNVLTVGFIVGGTGGKPVLVRGIGPTLATSFGVTGVLTNPVLTIFNASSVALYTDTIWGGTAALTQAMAQVFAFSLPANSADSVLLETLSPALYSAQVTGVGSSTGVALAEVYDADTSTNPTSFLSNFSARAVAGTGSSVLTAGFIVSGSGTQQFLVRGIGPTLGSTFGVTGALPTTALTVYDVNGNVIATNTNWGGGATLTQAFTLAGAFSLAANSADSAVLVTLPAGSYTASVSGVNGATGVALLEVYEVP